MNTNQERLAKICWNSNGWRTPSGLEGKSTDRGSYERITGFGHEEWLFDLDKLIDGYHYAYLRPVDNHRAAFVHQSFNVTLYTHNSRTKESYWVAKINNLQVIDKDEADQIVQAYHQKGWWNEMKDQLGLIGVDTSLFISGDHDATLFNVKFRPEDVEPFEGYSVPVDETLGQIPGHRYEFYFLRDAPTAQLGNTSVSAFIPSPPPDNAQDTRTKTTRTYKEGAREYEILHELIKNQFHAYLDDKYPKCIQSEAPTDVGNARIDLKLRNSNGHTIFYEVKSYPSAYTSIRVALGQLMEYAYLRGLEDVDELVVVSFLKAVPELENYLHRLKKKFGLPIGYIWFDHKEKIVRQAINCTHV